MGTARGLKACFVLDQCRRNPRARKYFSGPFHEYCPLPAGHMQHQNYNSHLLGCTEDPRVTPVKVCSFVRTCGQHYDPIRGGTAIQEQALPCPDCLYIDSTGEVSRGRETKHMLYVSFPSNAPFVGAPGWKFRYPCLIAAKGDCADEQISEPDEVEWCLMMDNCDNDQCMAMENRENRNGKRGNPGRDNPPLNVRRVRNNVPPFQFRYEGTGYPIYAAVDGEIPVGQSATVPTGYLIFPPRGTLVRVHGHPDIIMERRVAMEPFTFDALYKTELSVVLWNHGSSSFVFKSGTLLGVVTVEKPLRPWIEAVVALPTAGERKVDAPAVETVQSTLQALADTVADLSALVRKGQTADQGHF